MTENELSDGVEEDEDGLLYTDDVRNRTMLDLVQALLQVLLVAFR